jgi:two-component system OmpR family sensor kinase
VGQPDAEAPRFAVERVAAAPDGRRYRLLYRYRGPIGRPGPLSTPPSLVVLGIVGGPVFSGLMAWYLVAPIRRLRRGFRRLAAGELDARLAPEMGARRDEIADLARDLDAMAERLEESIAARERLLHDVSHEIRSPLARLQLAIGLARQDPARAAAALDRVEYEAGRLDTVIRELLTLAREEAGQGDRDQYFDLPALLETVLADARYEAEAAGVAVEAALAPAPAEGERPSVCGAAELVRWALENVVRNAVRFSAPGEAVRVGLRFERARGEYVVEVADQGPGAPSAELGSLFEPYVRRDRPGSGFGLGLAIAKRAVVAHGGRIEAENGPEGGLRVRIRLPA